MRRRVERTVQLLSDTNMSLSKIALPRSLPIKVTSRAVSGKYVGVSPQDYGRAPV
jgi:hypothetical protein